jgi:hypothetical protein
MLSRGISVSDILINCTRNVANDQVRLHVVSPTSCIGIRMSTISRFTNRMRVYQLNIHDRRVIAALPHYLPD